MNVRRSGAAKTILLTLICAASTGARADDSRSSSDAVNILRAALTLEARLDQQLGARRLHPCVNRLIGPAHVQGIGGHLRTVPYSWFGLDVSRTRSVHFDARLQPQEEAQIQAAERTAWVTAPSAIREIEQSWVAPQFHFCVAGDNQPDLVFSAPVIVGDMAFISVDYRCVLCGGGTLYALQRRPSGWTIIADTNQWLS